MGLHSYIRQLRRRAGAEGWPSAELGFPRCCRRAPSHSAQVQSSETWSAREKGVGDDESEAQSTSHPPPPGPTRLRRTDWLGRRVDWAGRGRDTATRPKVSRLLRARRCKEPALPPPFLSKVGAGLRRLSLSADQPTFDPSCGAVAEVLVLLKPHRL